MYLKKMIIFSVFFVFFVVIIQYFAYGADYDDGESGGPLTYDYYDMTCPSLARIVSLGIWKAIQNDTRMAASLLRLHYQDCFVNGCDASLLLDDTQAVIGEQTALPNKYSIRGLEVIDHIKTDLEHNCPSVISCADILALVARDAVFHSGGPFWDVLLGRLDGLKASKKSVLEQLPSPFESNLEKNIAKFAVRGLDTKDMVVLSGAHTIGFGHCFMYRRRLYNFSGTGHPDPSMDPALLSRLRSRCTRDERTSVVLSALDMGGAKSFDNSYFKNVMNNKGILQSDQDLMSNPKAAKMVKRYSMHSSAFKNDFAVSMVRLGNVGVITEGGEVRKKCGSRN